MTMVVFIFQTTICLMKRKNRITISKVADSFSAFIESLEQCEDI